MNITEEVQIIGPAFKKIANWTKQGTFLIKLSDWYEDEGLVHKYEYGLIERDTTGNIMNFNPSPIVCIVENDVGHMDIQLSITGDYASASGWSEYDQSGQTIYTRIWNTGTTGIWYYDLDIPKYTRAGSVFLLKGENLKYSIKIRDINARNDYGIISQPNDHLSFRALGDTNTKFLWSINWNKPFNYLKEIIKGIIGTPPLCTRCSGTGTISGIICKQCEGTQFAGFNASGLILRDHSIRAGIQKQDDETPLHFLNRLWSYNYWVTPTEVQAKNFIGIFAGIDPDTIEITHSSGLRGQEPEFHTKLPIPFGPKASFSEADEHWPKIIDSIAPACVIGTFSLIDKGFPSGLLNDLIDHNYYGDHIPTFYNYKGSGSTGWETGKYSPGFWAHYFNDVHCFSSAWRGEWGGEWLFFETGAASGYLKESGVDNQNTGGYELTYSGYWSHRGTGLTGFLDSGTCYYDNFYVSGGNGTGYIF